MSLTRLPFLLFDVSATSLFTLFVGGGGPQNMQKT
jgi:hypothetical protein